MAKITIDVPARLLAYAKAHGLSPEQLIALSFDGYYAKAHSLGDAPGRITRISGNSGNITVKNITHGDVNVLSNWKALLKIVFKPTSATDLMVQEALRLGILIGLTVGVTALCGYIFTLT
ncbi:MAG: hypothetical protein JNJ73_02000 [Hyphomonadaceae bacterium]|nr:hypothetical protein [Hyphomonadaceae bacterium]